LNSLLGSEATEDQLKELAENDTLFDKLMSKMFCVIVFEAVVRLQEFQKKIQSGSKIKIQHINSCEMVDHQPQGKASMECITIL